MAILPKAIKCSMQFPSKIPMTLIMEIEKSNLNLARVWGKETLIHCWW
jgi:hypothetical protein